MHSISNAMFVREAAEGLGDNTIQELRKFLRHTTAKQWHEGYVLAALMRGPFHVFRGRYWIDTRSKVAQKRR